MAKKAFNFTRSTGRAGSPSRLRISTEEGIRDVQIFSFKVSWDPIESEYSNQLPMKVQQRMPYYYDLISRSPKEGVLEMEALQQQFPDASIGNYLAIAYQLSGDSEKQEAQVIENLRRNPDYFFARAAYAELYFRRGDYDKIPEAFGGHFDLQSLYPDRTTFHVSEVVAFHGLTGLYLANTGKLDEAQVLLDLLQRVHPEHDLTQFLETTIMLKRTEGGFTHYMEKRARKRK